MELAINLDLDALAAEGYRFYAAESSEFAAISAAVVDAALRYSLGLS